MMSRNTLMVLILVLVGACNPQTPGPTPGSEPSIPATERMLVLTKGAILTADAVQQTENSPKNGATWTAVMAAKFAGRTQYAGTLTAMPATPTFPTGSRFCRPEDLKAEASGPDGAFGNIVLGAALKNISRVPCLLETQPRVTLTDPNGKVLDIDLSAPDSPQALRTPPAGGAAADMTGLLPGQAANFIIAWGNWCKPAVVPGAVIRLTLGGGAGSLDIPTGVPGGGRCDDPGTRSYVWVYTLDLAPAGN